MSLIEIQKRISVVRPIPFADFVAAEICFFSRFNVNKKKKN